MYEIRRLRPDNLALFRDMNRLFGEVFEDPDAYGAAPPPDDYVRDLLGRDAFVALTASEGGEMIGALAGYELPKFEQARSEFYLYDLAVRETHRRRGVATALIDALREVAAGRGGWVVFVQADYGDDPAVALYEKLGVREDVMHFDIAVEPRSGA